MKFKRHPTPEPDIYLPNLCGIRTVFAVVLIAQLFAFVLALGPMGVSGEDRWTQLGVMSLFIQWITLFSCSLLCVARPYLGRFSNRGVTIVSFAILLGVTALFSELTFWLYFEPVFQHGRDWHQEFLLRNLAIAAIVSGLLLRYFYVQQQWEKNLQAKSEARLQALQARIRPHFLFNSMNTIASLTRSDPRQAETAVENLADLFRASLSDVRDLITLEEELDLCRRYLDIETLRLGERLKVDWQTEALPTGVLIPPLTLQPLIENAIYHGIETRVDGGTIAVQGRTQEQTVEIEIINPKAEGATPAQTRGHQLAMNNIRERLTAHFGPAQRLKVEERDGRYSVTVTLPRKQTG
jgi:two-component system sensor histidine kinase AlgZ